MPTLPETVPYRWTATDELRAKSSPSTLTAYDVGSAHILDTSSAPRDVREIRVGDTVRVKLPRPSALLDLYFNPPYGLWEEAPASAAKCTTIGELIQELGKSPKKYPATWYGPTTNRQAKINQVRRLFDYWGNTDYRFEIFRAGFDVSYFAANGPDPYEIKCAAGGERLRYVVGLPVVEKKVHASPSAGAPQKVREPILDPDVLIYIRRLENAYADLADILDRNLRMHTELGKVKAQLMAIDAIAEVCANSGGPARLQEISKHTADITGQMPDFCNLRSFAFTVPDKSHKYAYGDGDRAVSALHNLVFEDSDASAHLRNYADKILTCGNGDSADVQYTTELLYSAIANAVRLLQEARRLVTEEDKLERILATDHASMKPAGSPLEAVYQVGTVVAQFAPFFVGNDRLSLIVMEAVALSKFELATTELSQGSVTRLLDLKTWLSNAVSLYLKRVPAAREALMQAIEAGDGASAVLASGELRSAAGGRAAVRGDIFLTLLQVVIFAAQADHMRDTGEVTLYDWTQLLAGGAGATIGVVTKVVPLFKTGEAVTKAAAAKSLLARSNAAMAVLGVFSAIAAGLAASEKGDYRAAQTSVMTVTGNLLMLAGAFSEVILVFPFINALGMVVMLGALSLDLYHAYRDKQKPTGNKVVFGLLESIRSNPTFGDLAEWSGVVTYAMEHLRNKSWYDDDRSYDLIMPSDTLATMDWLATKGLPWTIIGALYPSSPASSYSGAGGAPPQSYPGGPPTESYSGAGGAPPQ